MNRLELIREQLATHALAVCQTYLPRGRRSGAYWVVGDIDGNPGRSLYVRLTGRAGKWTDSATGQHGDCLDIIAHAHKLRSFAETLIEAERFLSLPAQVHHHARPRSREPDRSASARRLFAAARPIEGSHAERYLRQRGLTEWQGNALRYHPTCYARAETGQRVAYPALIAAISDLGGHITGVHRTWLSPDGPFKAPMDTPRRSMGRMVGHGVRFGQAGPVLLAGEGLETVLTLRSVLPWIPCIAALTATHLGLLELPPGLERLYIARDNDHAGLKAWTALSEKALSCGVRPCALIPRLKDWNDDLVAFGFDQTVALARSQLLPFDLPHR